MKLVFSDIKKGELKLKVDFLDDLWYLSQVIDPGDILSGKTLRKIRIGDKEERASAQAKKSVFLSIKVEKVEFHKYSDILRVSGTVVDGPEDVPRGSYHTFSIELGTIFTLAKEKLMDYQFERIKEACSQKPVKILICVFDREDAMFALLKQQGYELLTSIEGDVQKKADVGKKESNFYKEIIKQMKDYDERYKLDRIIAASPAFWKDELMKAFGDDKIKQKIKTATCSSVSKNAVEEILKRAELQELLKEDQVARETKLVEELLYEISKSGKAAYGIKEVKNAVDAGAVATLMVTDKLIQSKRQLEKFDEIEAVMKSVDMMKGQVKIINSDNEAGRKLDGLGGIGAILRFKLSY